MLTRKTYSTTLTVILALAIILGLFNKAPTIVLTLSALGLVLAIVYALIYSQLSWQERVIILVMAIIPFVSIVFVTMHYPGAGIIHFALLVPISLFAYLSFNSKGKLRTEFPFLTAMAIISLMLFF